MTHLMQPRYKVIADYPGSQLRIGDILVDEQKDYELWRNNRDLIMWQFSPAQYPANFRRLQWWEDRQPEEMPKYVKDDAGNIHRVISWYSSGLYVKFKGIDKYPFHKDSVLPATLEEYNDYQNRHENQQS